MQYRQLGDSDLKVSEIALGTWLTFGVGIERDQAIASIDKAFDLGINFIDTANVYGVGAAESLLGEALKDRQRDNYILGTKVFFPMEGGEHGLSKAQIEKQLDASLKRLGTDYIDLYQCHRYDKNTPLEETMEALSAAVTSGKVRYLGFSEWSPANIQASLDLPGVEKFVSSQPQYSLLWRRPEEKVIPLCAANGISQVVWSPLAQGVLSGKYVPGQPLPGDSRAAQDTMNRQMGHWLRPEVIEAVHAMKPLAEAAGVTLAQFCLAWVLREPNVAAAIVGVSRPEQLEQNAAASGLVIDPALFAKAEALAEEIPAA
ncbi:aldo/keto reductase family protein [Maricaulis parjimensis]|uniref:aldo/keto reductase family protein n=1 Tax=Maricaulis parjimensis TaxID=144023 RepID=UPI00193A22BF|nr:aldo/keto reductase family protein [Maricaulis parjimensis]